MVREDQVFVGIDVGGTFTDLVMFDAGTGQMTTVKVPSSPPDFYPSVIEALKEAGVDEARSACILHGTTVHLNAFLERKGAKTALVTTSGFGDVYEMRRGNRPQPYNIHFQYPAPLVPRKHVFEVEERMLANGDIMVPVNREAIKKLAAEIKAASVEAVSLCFLHSYRNPENENIVAEVLKAELPDLFISASSEICREWREFERTSTAVINAYVSPVLKWYLSNLGKALENRKETRLFLLQSNGGLISAGEAKDKGVLTLLSGPVGGNVACQALAGLGDEKNLICIDMGGTSFEASLVVDGGSAIRHEREVGGFPVLTPMVDIHTIGAGGGSIAWNDSGALRVGPHSAGARPGPACYGVGGTQATVTDANMVLGRLEDGTRFGNDLKLDASLARTAVASFAEEFGLSVEGAAQGILDVINEQMANAIRTITVRRGIDPRNFALVAYGGAGPMHAADIARLLGIRSVIVPRSAGTFSAWGMLQSDMLHDQAVSMLSPLVDVDWQDLGDRFAAIERDMADVLASEGVANEDMEFIRALDIRYEGQEYSIQLPLEPEFFAADADPAQTLESVRKMFDALYLQTYGHSNPEENLEVSTLRLRAIGRSRLDVDAFVEADRSRAEDNVEIHTRPIMFDGQPRPTRFVGRSYLVENGEVAGPLVVMESTCTTIVPPDFTAALDTLGNVILTLDGGEA